MFEYLPAILVFGMAGTIWLYVVARIITRAVVRTLDERKRRKEDEEAEAGQSRTSSGERPKRERK